MAIIKQIKNFFFKLYYGFRGVPFQVGDHTIYLDESLRRWDLAMESSVHQVLEKNLSPGDIFFDVGANFGLHTLYSAKLVGNDGCVFAFEPVPSHLKLLERNARLSHVSEQVTIVPKAVSSSQDSFLEFFVPVDEIAVTASLKQTNRESQKMKVPNLRLDDFWQNSNSAIKAIKIDVEGAELEVLKGATNILNRWHPILVIEVHGFALPDFGTSVEEFRSFLQGFGYHETRLEGEQFEGNDYYQAVYVCGSTYVE